MGYYMLGRWRKFKTKRCGAVATVMLMLVAVVQMPLCAASQVPPNRNTQVTTHHLSQLQSHISRLQAHLQLENSRQLDYQHQLAEVEEASGHVATGLQHTHSHLHVTQSTLQGLRKQSGDLQSILAKRQQVLAQQLRQIYILGHPGLLGVVLDQQSPAHWARMLTYYRALQQAQYKAIAAVTEVLSEVKVNRQQMHQQLATIWQLHRRLLQQQQQKRYLSEQRRHALQALSQQIQTEQQKLRALQSERQHLQSMLSSMKRSHQATLNFRHLRHHLPWPVAGHIIQAFGAPLTTQGHLSAEGIVIAAATGQPVRAVAAGTVVFARWLAGYGLLIIIDHGDGYMTLYGRNQSLDKQVGDKVSAGQVIALVGESGGFSYPSSYFAVRHNAKALDPRSWLL